MSDNDKRAREMTAGLAGLVAGLSLGVIGGLGVGRPTGAVDEHGHSVPASASVAEPAGEASLPMEPPTSPVIFSTTEPPR